jgi:hypothetical protein
VNGDVKLTGVHWEETNASTTAADDVKPREVSIGTFFACGLNLKIKIKNEMQFEI